MGFYMELLNALEQRSPAFWYQGLVSWKTVFPRTGVGRCGGVGGMLQVVMQVMGSHGERQMKLHSLTCRSPPAVRPGVGGGGGLGAPC